ncbi:MAG: VCBS repeat-containing protein [Akkermansiaceae bacterium]|nr:VCBS repeat-containing protein [Akkermansiaceae bacterium]NNM30502.1 VCBS repeat-containing protein [Akkermansiaceae bacterium]
MLALAATLAAAGGEESWTRHGIDDFSSGADGVRLGDVDRDGRPDVVTGWEEGGFTRVCLNPGPEKAREAWPAVTVGKTPHVEDAMFVDLDGDGRLDVVSCCEGRTKSIFVHWGPADGKRLRDGDAWQTEALPASQGRMMWMFAVPMQVDGRHGIDLVAGGKGRAAEIGWFEAPEDGRQTGAYRYHPIGPVGWVMSIRSRDMDGDGDDDVLISDRKGADAAVRWLENPGPGELQRMPWKSHLVSRSEEKGTNYMFLDAGDLDGDGLEDVVFGAYARESVVVVARRLDQSGRKWAESSIRLKKFGMGRAKAAGLGDIDGDGQLDVAVSCGMAEGRHGVACFSRAGQSLDAEWTWHPVSGRERGSKFDRLELLDLDGDGDLDVLTCEENDGPKSRGLGVIWYENPAG